MSDFRNLRLYNLDAEWRKYFDRSADTPAWFVPAMELMPSAAQEFVVCEYGQSEPSIVFSALPYYKLRWPGGIPVLRVARTLLATGDWESARVRELIYGITRLGKSLGAFAVELEVFRKVDAPIFFPASNCIIDACNSPDLDKVLAKMGLEAMETSRTWQLSLDSVVDRGNLRHGLKVKTTQHGRKEDREVYYRIWKESKDFPVAFPTRGGDSVSWLGLRPWYENTCPWLNQQEFILFAELHGQLVGFVHWWPNLYKLDRKVLSSGGVIHENLAQSIGQIAEAKVFKLAIAKRLGSRKNEMAEILVLKALELMREQFGILTCQISLPTGAESMLNRLWAELDARIVQEKAFYSLRT